MSAAKFKKTIWDYYRKNGRKMPWRSTRDPYRILVSEIMLQQTQVGRVEKFYKNFIKQFPNFRALGAAKTPEVLRAWQGLGYNRRALALQRLAREVVEQRGGRLPSDAESLIELPGIGEYTAGAIRAFAFNEPEIFIETNIRRVFLHFFFPRQKSVTDAMLKRCIERTIEKENPREWYYALMDYGAMLGGAARGRRSVENPNRRSAHYAKQSVFGGSNREARGRILRELLAKKKVSAAGIPENVIESLAKEGFLLKNGRYIELVK